MKKLTILTGFAFILLSCSNKKQYNINCKIEGLKSDSALIAFFPQSDRDIEIVDTVVFIDGELNYDFQVSELHEGFIIPYDLIYKFENGSSYPLPASRINFFIDSLDYLEINATISSQCIDYQITGNLLSEQLTEARKMKLPLFKERVIFEYDYNSSNSNKITESEYRKKSKENDLEYQNQSIAYIEMNPDAEYAARLLLEIRNKEKAAKLYNSLVPKVKNSYFGTVIGDMVNGWMLTNPGLQFPNIADKTIEGEVFNLVDLRGKFVLIDFWGSWCEPCIVEIPKLKKIKESYKEKLEIVGIACNDNKERLIKTVESNQIDWPQILEGNERDTKYSNLFGIKNYPTKILLDKEGKIFKVYIGLDDSVYIDIEKLL